MLFKFFLMFSVSSTLWASDLERELLNEVKALRKEVKALSREVKDLKSGKKNDSAPSKATSKNDLQYFEDLLKEDLHRLEDIFKTRQFSKDELNIVISKRVTLLKDIPYQNSFESSHIDLIIESWKNRNEESSRSLSTYALKEIVDKYNINIDLDMAKRLVDADIRFFVKIDSLFKDDPKALNEIGKIIEEKLTKSDYKYFLKFNRGLNEIFKSFPHLTMPYLERHSQKYINDKSQDQETKQFKSVFARLVGDLKISREQKRSLLLGKNEKVECSDITYNSVEALNLDENEVLRCSSVFKDKKTRDSYLKRPLRMKKSNSSLTVPVVSLFLKFAPEEIMRFVDFLDRSKEGKKVLKSFIPVIKKEMLFRHMEIANYRFNRGGSGREKPLCGRVFINCLKDDLEFNSSLALSAPHCTNKVDSKFFSNQDFLSNYLKGWQNLTQRIGDRNYYRIMRDYYYYDPVFFHNDRNLSKRLRISKFLRVTPLRDIPLDIYKNKKLVTSLLELFPEDYERIPPLHREDYSKFEEVGRKKVEKITGVSKKRRGRLKKGEAKVKKSVAPK